ncbi:MAG TPA: PHP domain-containing protein, partial [Thermoanaerobaculia bacterium]
MPDPPDYPKHRPAISPPVPARGSGYASPGARKERLKKRTYRKLPAAAAPYAELHAVSAFSFLEGASLPEDLIQRAAELELPAVALIDRNGVYGAPRFYQAAKQAGIKALVGAEVVLEDDGQVSPGRQAGHRPLGLVPEPRPTANRGAEGAEPGRLTLLVASREGYRNLCRILTTAARGRPKGEAAADWELLAAHAGGLRCLTGGEEGPLARTLAAEGPEAARRLLERLQATFPGRVHVELQRHRQRDEEHRNQALLDLARRLRLPVVATNGVRYARPEDKPLHDVLTSLRHHTHLDAAGRLLAAHRERHLKTAADMARAFPELPGAVAAAAELAASLDFTLA